ncbi:hypothetical protein DITRI_Ditri15bG0119700 [Diplodiscus trichospermus]
MCFHFETPEKPDSFIAFLEKHGFSKTQVTNIIRRQPHLLVFDIEKTLFPKIEFLYSIGFSKPDLTKLLTSYPGLFRTSLEKQIIPSFNVLRNMFQSDDKAIKVIKWFTSILSRNLDSQLFPNMDILRRNGVPESNIVTMLLRQPRTLMFNSVRLKEIVEEVKRTGIDSSRMKFVEATFALRSMSKSTLEKKFDIYRRWGWSDQEIHEAFRKYPKCLTVSEDKIMAVMDFLVNKMGFNSTLVAKQSSILRVSLENVIVPRALFAQELLSRGLVNNDLTLSALFDASEEVFLRSVEYVGSGSHQAKPRLNNAAKWGFPGQRQRVETLAWTLALSTAFFSHLLQSDPSMFILSNIKTWVLPRICSGSFESCSLEDP